MLYRLINAQKVTRRIEQLDADIAFANFGKTLESFCFPEFVEESGILEITQGKHPTVNIENFIPNDVTFGDNKEGDFNLSS